MIVSHSSFLFAFGTVSLVVVLLTGCRSKQSSQPAEPAPLIPLAQEIQSRGYQIQKSQIDPPNAWETSTFRMRRKLSYWFRAKKPLASARDTYYRFTLFEETYDSIDDARNRLAKLHDEFPQAQGGPEDDEYVRAMRTGFRVGNVIYVFQTDALMFWEETKGLAKTLGAGTPDAELEPSRVNR